MDATTLLKEDHRKVEELLKEVQGLSESAHVSRQKLFRKIDEELTVHSKIEEKIFYPALKAKADAAKEDDTEQEVLEAYEEHANIKEMLEKLASLEPTDETYNAKLQVLGDLVKHHVHEEEHVMFKEAHSLFSKDELDAIGERLARAKAELVAVGV